MIGRSCRIMSDRNGACFLQMPNEIFFVSLIVFMGTTRSTVDIACIPANFKECYDSSCNIIFMMKQFYSGNNESNVQ